MTRDELDEILHQCYSVEIFPEEAAELIWGKAFEGETEKIQSFAEKALLYENWLKQAELQLTELYKDWLKQADASRPIDPTDNTKPSY